MATPAPSLSSEFEKLGVARYGVPEELVERGKVRDGFDFAPVAEEVDEAFAVHG